MNAVTQQLEAEGWERDITINGTPKPGSASFSTLRRRHLATQGFEVQAVDLAPTSLIVLYKRERRR